MNEDFEYFLFPRTFEEVSLDDLGIVYMWGLYIDWINPVELGYDTHFQWLGLRNKIVIRNEYKYVIHISPRYMFDLV